MVFVAVRKDYRPEAVSVFEHVRNIGDNQVDSEHVVFGEHESRVNHNHFVAVADNCHVLADFAQTAERNNF